jgi:hypothetical protein
MANFKKTIHNIAAQNEWEVEWGDGFASLQFEIEGGTIQTVFITDNGETVEFAIPCNFFYETEADIDHAASTQLLRRNAELAVGAWVIEKTDDGWHFSVMYNEALATLENMAPAELAASLELMLTEASSLAAQE